MSKNIRICITPHTVCRSICSSDTMYKSYVARESKFISKLLNRNEPKRKWYNNNTPASLNPYTSSQKKQQSSIYVKRRIDVLNKLFMKHITELMSTSEIASELYDRGVEVTYVSMTSDYKILNVFWTFEKEDDKNWPRKIEEVLDKYSFILRHELSQLRVINYVPIIKFVKDIMISRIKNVEKRFAMFDFDKDHKETDDTIIQSDITNDNKTDNSTDKNQIILPQMKHDVLGLDHHGIMLKIKNSIYKLKNHTSRDKMLNRESEKMMDPLSTSLDNKDTLRYENQQELFIEFLKKRKIEERRKYSFKNPKRVVKNPFLTHDDADDKNTETYFDDNFESTYNKIDEHDFEKEKF
ncbi:uncharacterized protein LOC118449978 [Vespa mandarinia]|uniref:uncharacterized protein LOC118449978 n=1 Tax=Vespa mandarinia TaxID=7446 RepID=UPI001620A315|nr:uncharacterized protein LOC118449978 [Vespa mandarinia]